MQDKQVEGPRVDALEPPAFGCHEALPDPDRSVVVDTVLEPKDRKPQVPCLSGKNALFLAAGGG